MTLRPYQREALDRARAAYAAGARSVLLVSPTGSGKTRCAAEAIRAAVTKGRRVLVIAPRREIVAQTSARLTAAGVEHGIVAASTRNPAPDAPVQLGMAQTVRRRDTAAADLLVIDEAHLDEYGAVVDAHPRAHRLLLTATPLRSSARPWRGLADALVEVETVAGLVSAGYLVEPLVWSAQTPDLAGVRRGTGGELSPSQAGARYQASVILGDTVEQWRRRCRGLRTLVFASSVPHSRQLAAALAAAGARAAHVDGTTPAAEREATLAALAAGELDAVCNYGVLCEGLDVPAVGAVIVARATQSESLWRQMVGRGLRPHHAPGCRGDAGCAAACKRACVVVDQGGNASRHGHPMAPRAWTLDGVERREPDPDAPPACRTCAACMAVYPSPGTVCPRCEAVWVPEVRRPPKALTRAELALLRPDGTVAPSVVIDGQRRAPRPMPGGLAERWRAAWEQVELRRLAAGYHWRWSLREMRSLGAPVVVEWGRPWG